MAKLTNEEIIEALKEMTLLEASELVKAIEETFGVSAAAPAAVYRRPRCRCSRRGGEDRV